MSFIDIYNKIYNDCKNNKVKKDLDYDYFSVIISDGIWYIETRNYAIKTIPQYTRKYIEKYMLNNYKELRQAI